MTDDELVHAFESTDLPPKAFTHEAHVRVAWCYLRASPFHVALARFAMMSHARSASAGRTASSSAAQNSKTSVLLSDACRGVISQSLMVAVPAPFRHLQPA